MNDYINHCLHNYCNFNGRANKKEFWFLILFNILNILLINIIPLCYLLSNNDCVNYGIFGISMAIFELFMLLPTLSCCTRRLHDTGKSAWYFLFLIIPYIGEIILIILCCQKSQIGRNKWGINSNL